MSEEGLIISKIGERSICLKGIGQLFFQNGLPISMSIARLKEKGVEVSLFHVADECLKNGWSAKTTFNKLKADAEDDIDKSNVYDIPLLEKYCFASWEEQCEMKFQYLFGYPSADLRNGTNKTAADWLNEQSL